ncbi:hypothetical protein ACHAWF_011190 [Thalassiosira exigua]
MALGRLGGGGAAGPRPPRRAAAAAASPGAGGGRRRPRRRRRRRPGARARGPPPTAAAGAGAIRKWRAKKGTSSWWSRLPRRRPATAVAGARGVDDGGSETEMEDEEEENVENNSSGVEKGKGGARGRGSRVAREDDDGNDDGDDAANDDGNDDDGDATTDDEPPKRRAAAEGKGKRKVALASDSSDDDDDEKKKIAPAADSGDDDEEEESSPRRRRSPRKRGGRRVVAAGDSDEDEEEDFGAKKRSSVRRGGGAKKVGTFGDGNDNDGNDNDNGDDVGVGDGDDDVDDDDDDDNDGDFKPQAAGGDDSSGAEEVVVPARRPGKRRASSSPPRRSSPRKKQASPRKKAAPEPKRAAVPRDPAVPPKYHPPSSRLLQRMPFLANDPSVSVRVALTLPKLPGDGGDPTFPLDDFTPRCLEGSTFVFTGILSTNPEKTRAANRELQLASPGKGDYYAHRNLDSGCAAELSREAAADVVKSLGGKATTSVSGKTDYLVCGSVLEDGREVEEGSKHRRATELWEIWETKWRGDYEEEGGGGRGKDEKKKAKKKRTKAQLKDRDPNSLVEIIRGVDEFYGLVASLSEWKRGTLSEEERKALDAGRPRRKASAEVVRAEATSETKPEVKEEPTTPANPRGGAPAPTRAAARNPYAPRPSSAAAAPPADNPYARKASPVANPYARKASPANPYAKKPAASSSSYAGPVKSDRPGRPLHPATGKELLPHSLWADKYAPSSTSEILGNADSVTKLRRWLSSWEDTFNDPQRPVKGLTNPGGPKKAALLSGPPGIGELFGLFFFVRFFGGVRTTATIPEPGDARGGDARRADSGRGSDVSAGGRVGISFARLRLAGGQLLVRKTYRSTRLDRRRKRFATQALRHRLCQLRRSKPVAFARHASETIGVAGGGGSSPRETVRTVESHAEPTPFRTQPTARVRSPHPHARRQDHHRHPRRSRVRTGRPRAERFRRSLEESPGPGARGRHRVARPLLRTRGRRRRRNDQEDGWRRRGEEASEVHRHGRGGRDGRGGSERDERADPDDQGVEGPHREFSWFLDANVPLAFGARRGRGDVAVAVAGQLRDACLENGDSYAAVHVWNEASDALIRWGAGS